LHRCDVLSEHYRKRLPEICEPFLPGIREIVNGDIPYAEVVAKILTPDRVQDCNPFEVYPVSVMGGDVYMSALKKPFPHVPMVASQGIQIGSIKGYVEAGASAVVLSDAIFD